MERETQVCTKCGQRKDIDEYYRQPRNKNGRASYCKDCYKRQQIKVQSRVRSTRSKLSSSIVPMIEDAINHNLIVADLVVFAERHLVRLYETPPDLEMIVSVFNGDCPGETEFLSKIERCGENYRRRLNEKHTDKVAG